MRARFFAPGNTEIIPHIGIPVPFRPGCCVSWNTKRFPCVGLPTFVSSILELGVDIVEYLTWSYLPLSYHLLIIFPFVFFVYKKQNVLKRTARSIN